MMMSMTRCTVMINHDTVNDFSYFITRNAYPQNSSSMYQPPLTGSFSNQLFSRVFLSRDFVRATTTEKRLTQRHPL